ncbi:MAG: CatB-related O-acetyltransferase [Alphaproteobacteria bacterium]|nr:CatB-related O-acetyltransferase [Alphaproteobacteria bacterium]
MSGLIAALIEKAKIRFWRRNQFTSAPLRAWFRERHRVDVGLYSYGCFDQWRMPGPIRIGRYCSIANSVRSAPINHPTDALTTHPVLYEKQFGVVDADIYYDEPLVIEDDVWIGHNALILPGCKYIGRGAIIGAGAVVTRNVERYTIVAGNPARKLRDRFPADLAEAIEASQWWKLDLAELRTLVRDRRNMIFHPDLATLQAWQADRTR